MSDTLNDKRNIPPFIMIECAVMDDYNLSPNEFAIYVLYVKHNYRITDDFYKDIYKNFNIRKHKAEEHIKSLVDKGVI